MTTVPLYVPALPAVNATVIVHEAFEPTLDPQPVLWLKEPVLEMPEIVSAVAPVLVNVTFCVGGGQVKPALHEKLRLPGMSRTVPFVSVIAAVADLLGSPIETALTLTLPLDGIVAGPVKVEVAPLAALEGFIVPQAGEQFAPFCVSVQFNP